MDKYKRCDFDGCPNYCTKTEKYCDIHRGTQYSVSPIKSPRIYNFDALIRNQAYGTKAYDIYLICCEKFGWDKSQKGQFRIMKPLYAFEGEQKKKRSIWFISNSNWTDTKNEKWRNIIKDKTIEEYWEKSSPPLYDSKTDRIIFAKNSSREYIFLGIYKVKEQTKDKRIYELYSSVYPD
jgi:hypothetical protein